MIAVYYIIPLSAHGQDRQLNRQSWLITMFLPTKLTSFMGKDMAWTGNTGRQNREPAGRSEMKTTKTEYLIQRFNKLEGKWKDGGFYSNAAPVLELIKSWNLYGSEKFRAVVRTTTIVEKVLK